MTFKTIDTKTLDSMQYGCTYVGSFVHVKMRFGKEKADAILVKLSGYRNDIKIACTPSHTFITAIVHKTSNFMYDLNKAKGFG